MSAISSPLPLPKKESSYEQILPLHTRVDGAIHHHVLHVWKTPSTFVDTVTHTMKVLTGSRQRVELHGEELFVDVEEMKYYGMQNVLEKPESFQQALEKTKMWMQNFVEELHDEQRLSKILHILHTSTLQDNAFSIISINDSSEMLLVHTANKTAHLIASTPLAKGGSAEVFGAGPFWVIRKPFQEHSEENRKKTEEKQRRADRHLRKIHAQKNVIGVESPPKSVSYIDPVSFQTLNQTTVTVSKRALGNGFDLMEQISIESVPLIAHYVTRGLKACIDAEIGHIDIKLENIVLYGQKTTSGQYTIHEACLIDFDATIPLDNASTYYQNYPTGLQRGYTRFFILDTDFDNLDRLIRHPDHFAAFRSLAYQISIFEMGIVLYQLYACEDPPIGHDKEGFINDINQKAIEDALRFTEPELTETQQSILCAMLDIDPSKRPCIQDIVDAFDLVDMEAA